MKKVCLILSLLLLPACSGFVNQERVYYTDLKKANVDSELITYVVKIDEILKVYDRETTTESNLNLDSEKLASQLNISHKQAEKLVKIAEDLDQINSQNYPMLFTIFLGLNANPSNPQNRQQFWESLNGLIEKTYESRNLQIEVQKEILLKRISRTPE